MSLIVFLAVPKPYAFILRLGFWNSTIILPKHMFVTSSHSYDTIVHATRGNGAESWNEAECFVKPLKTSTNIINQYQ
jgi:hypothetical protein